jgi:hypothetical protein
MHRLNQRLRKLEARIDVGPSWCDCYQDYYAEASRVARSMLSSADRDLLADVFALKRESGHSAFTEVHRSVWERWSEVFDKAVAELGHPFSMYASDEWL